MIDTYYQILVSPGIGAVLQTFLFFIALIKELLPTLGNPMIPTDIDFFLDNFYIYLRIFNKL